MHLGGREAEKTDQNINTSAHPDSGRDTSTLFCFDGLEPLQRGSCCHGAL